MNLKYIIITIILTLFLCGTASAWLSGYDHRMQIDINNTNDNLTDYQYNFTVNTATLVSASKMQIDGSDCRITNATDILQEFWNKTSFNNTSTKIIVNATSLGNVTNTTHYFYYGNTGASSVSNITTTMVVGDDFNYTSQTFINESANNPVLTPTDAWEGTGVIEPSVLMNGSTMDIWYRAHATNGQIGYATASDSNCSQWNRSASNPLTDIVGVHDLPYVLKNGSIYYMFIKKMSDCQIYLYNSTNKVNWTIMNGGSPVLTHSTTSSDWDYQIFNVGVTVVDGTWHMLYEGKSSTSGFRMGYSYSNLTELNWNTHSSSNIVIDTSGNPDLTYIPDRNAIIAIHGDNSNTIWEIIAHYANISDDLSLAANWHDCDGFDTIKHAGIHDADPHMVITNFTKDYNIIIPYCYNQDEIYQVYCNLSLNDFFDRITTTNQVDTSLWDVTGTITTNADGLTILLNSNRDTNYVVSNRTLSRSQAYISEMTYQQSNTAASDGTGGFGTSGAFTNGLWLYAEAGTACNRILDGSYISSWTTSTRSANTDWKMKVLLKETQGFTLWDQYNLDSDYTQRDDNAAWATDNVRVRLGNAYANSDILLKQITVRKYSLPEPVASVGVEENAPAGNNVVLGANKYGMLRKDVTAAQTFSTIASGFTHDVCFTWWDDVTDTWMSYWVGDSYNSAQSIPEHESYFVLMDSTGETVSCSVAAAETVAIPVGWSVTYLRESTSKTLTAIKSDMGGNCVDLYAWNHTESGTGSWTNTGAYSVLPNQGLLVNASTGFNWDGAVP